MIHYYIGYIRHFSRKGLTRWKPVVWAKDAASGWKDIKKRKGFSKIVLPRGVVPIEEKM